MRTEDIVNKVFTRSFMGYDIEQVDRFLDEVIECLEGYEAEKKEMLAAMEFLLNKVEKGKKLPLGEMRKAIERDRPQKKRPLPPERALDAAAPEKRRERAAQTAEEAPAPKADAKAARSIGRGANAAQKPAPKVQRVVKGEAESAAPGEPAAKAAPGDGGTKDGWFDELLTNLCERERQGFAPPPVCEERIEEKAEEEPPAEALAPQTNAAAFEQSAPREKSEPAPAVGPAPVMQANAPAPKANPPEEPPAALTDPPAPKGEPKNEGPQGPHAEP